jgi:hypothetical protein
LEEIYLFELETCSCFSRICPQHSFRCIDMCTLLFVLGFVERILLNVNKI